MIKPKTIVCFVYSEMEKHINETYNCNIRDFANRYPTKEQLGVILAKYPNIDYKAWKSLQFTKMNSEELALKEELDTFKAGKEYLDFWHYLLDKLSIKRDELSEVCFQEILDEEDPDSWQAKILQMFVNEFGTGLVTIHFSW